MRQFAGASLALVICVMFCSRPRAQEPPPRIGPFVVDVHGTFPRFPNDLELAQSRGLDPAQLPGHGVGVDVGAHVYLLRWRAMTIGVGGQLTFGRAHWTPSADVGPTAGLLPVSERFLSAAPQVSFNFGTGHGWSYLSGGTAGRSGRFIRTPSRGGRPGATEDHQLRRGAWWFEAPPGVQLRHPFRGSIRALHNWPCPGVRGRPC